MKRISGLAFACSQSWPVVDFLEMFVFVVCCVVFINTAGGSYVWRFLFLKQDRKLYSFA